MGVPERKKRNLEARETLILDCAQKYLLTQGFQNLNLDDVARDMAVTALRFGVTCMCEPILMVRSAGSPSASR